MEQNSEENRLLLHRYAASSQRHWPNESSTNVFPAGKRSCFAEYQ